jgi:transketolase
MSAQASRNEKLIRQSRYMRPRVESSVLPLRVDLAGASALSADQVHAIEALQVEAARIAIQSLASLAKINELDHLGGGLDLIPAFMLTLAATDYDKVHYTIEHAHTSIGYFSSLAALGFLDRQLVIDGFRRGLDIAGHVSWVPGGTELNGGRLGVMVPAAVGQALGVRALKGAGSWVLCHCGDAGWISGQALNGFNGADLHKAPITFIMHRNGIQLSGTNAKIMNKDPRPIIASQGIEIIETPTLLDVAGLYKAYKHGYELAQKGRPSLIYPVGFANVALREFGENYGVAKELEHFAAKHKVDLATKVWIPGSLMSYRDTHPMLECLFHVNNLPGGEGHHDGHMKGRKEEDVLAGSLFQQTAEQKAALTRLASQPKKKVVTEARPSVGSKNLVLPEPAIEEVQLPAVGKSVSPRAGVEAGYAAVAKTFPDHVFLVSCDLDPSTKLGKARTYLKHDHCFEMSIEEQVSAIMANGLACSSRRPQLNVFATFAAFFEGIAREGFEMWRYQRNLTGVNEGLNVTMHLSHVGSCTGRDHFSGWSLDWITLALGYLPYLHRFYAPADARAAFLAVKDLAAHYGGHIIGIPRDNLPILEKQGTTQPLWEPGDAWEAVTQYRKFPDAKKAILALGATVSIAGQAADRLKDTDVYAINGLPWPADTMAKFVKQYPAGLVTVEDGLIATPDLGLRGFAGLVQSAAAKSGIPMDFIGIADPRVAPSEGHVEVWEFFGITADAIADAVRNLHRA